MIEIKNKIKKLSTKERQILDKIAINISTGHSLTICRKLEKLGLIEDAGEVCIGKDAFGKIYVTDWQMPIAVHIEWCYLCQEKHLEEK